MNQCQNIVQPEVKTLTKNMKEAYFKQKSIRRLEDFQTYKNNMCEDKQAISLG